MVILTGGSGFIGSNFLKKLNDEGIDNILIVDYLDSSEKWKNLNGKKFDDYIDKDSFIKAIQNNMFSEADAIFHFGACSSTTEINAAYLIENNYFASKNLLEWSLKNNIKFIYASSAATYGDGSNGFSDENENTLRLKPLNIYGFSKQLFDQFIIRNNLDTQVTGLKFFNVFGPNEYHKENMRSMVHKAFEQYQATGRINLFKSNDPNYKDGEQKRDFIYVKDCVKIVWWLYHNNITGIFNVGSGKANSWISLAKSVFDSLSVDQRIEFIDMPLELSEKYQNFTLADISKLNRAGYHYEFFSFEEAIADYIQNHLLQKDQYN